MIKQRDLVMAAVGAVVAWWYVSKMGGVLDDAQLAANDGFAWLSGLSEYEQALMDAESVAEIRALQAAWEDRPWWQKF